MKCLAMRPVTRSGRSVQSRANSNSPDPGVTTEASGKACAKKRESLAYTYIHIVWCVLFGVLHSLIMYTYCRESDCEVFSCETCDWS